MTEHAVGLIMYLYPGRFLTRGAPYGASRDADCALPSAPPGPCDLPQYQLIFTAGGAGPGLIMYLSFPQTSGGEVLE